MIEPTTHPRALATILLVLLCVMGTVGAAQSLAGWYVMKGSTTLAGPFASSGDCSRVERQTSGATGCEYQNDPQTERAPIGSRFRFRSPGAAAAEAIAKTVREQDESRRLDAQLELLRQADARDAERHEAEMKRLVPPPPPPPATPAPTALGAASDVDRLEAIRLCSDHVRDVGPKILAWRKADFEKRLSETGSSSADPAPTTSGATTTWDFSGHFNGEMKRCFLEAKVLFASKGSTLIGLNVYDAFEGQAIGRFTSVAEEGKPTITLESKVFDASVDEAVYRALMRN